MLEQISQIGAQAVEILNQVQGILVIIGGIAGLGIWRKHRVAEDIRREAEQALRKAAYVRGVVEDGVAYAQHIKEQGADDPNAKRLTGRVCKGIALEYIKRNAPDALPSVTDEHIMAAVTKLKGARKTVERDPKTGKFVGRVQQ